MKHLVFVFLVMIVFSCQSNDEIDCSSYLTVPTKSLFIKLVDNNGNNLIENETYIADDIKIVFNGYTNNQVVFKNVPGIENLIVLNIFGNEGNNTFNIQLSDNETDILILNLDTEEPTNPCGFTFFKLNSATYNDVVETIEDFNGEYLITIVK